jgi:hypothetical protein
MARVTAKAGFPGDRKGVGHERRVRATLAVALTFIPTATSFRSFMLSRCIIFMRICFKSVDYVECVRCVGCVTVNAH